MCPDLCSQRFVLRFICIWANPRPAPVPLKKDTLCTPIAGALYYYNLSIKRYFAEITCRVAGFRSRFWLRFRFDVSRESGAEMTCRPMCVVGNACLDHVRANRDKKSYKASGTGAATIKRFSCFLGQNIRHVGRSVSFSASRCEVGCDYRVQRQSRNDPLSLGDIWCRGRRESYVSSHLSGTFGSESKLRAARRSTHDTFGSGSDGSGRA